MKFVCYKEFDDTAEPTFPGVLYKGKTLPLARLVAVAEAIHPRGISVPEDLNALIAELPTYASALKELEKGKILDLIWQEVGIVPAPPLARPNRILGIGRNFPDHAAEHGHDPAAEPIVFSKSPGTVIADQQPIVLPSNVGRVDYEGEIAVVIGRKGKNVPEAEAMGLVAGYTLCNDITARDHQKRDQARGLPWFLSKSYDTFCPLGPCIVTADEIRNPASLEISLSVNGIVKQKGSLSSMLFSVPALISYLSRFITLEPGDLIMTGTPSGVGPLHPGDVVEVSSPSIGTLKNPVIGTED